MFGKPNPYSFIISDSKESQIKMPIEVINFFKANVKVRK